MDDDNIRVPGLEYALQKREHRRQRMAEHFGVTRPTVDEWYRLYNKWLDSSGTDAAALSRLLELRWPIDARGPQGETLLVQAIWFRSAASVAVLLGRGADRSIKDLAERTAADYARESSDPGIIELLASE
jgi:hypothetical protein